MSWWKALAEMIIGGIVFLLILSIPIYYASLLERWKNDRSND